MRLKIWLPAKLGQWTGQFCRLEAKKKKRRQNLPRKLFTGRALDGETNLTIAKFPGSSPDFPTWHTLGQSLHPGQVGLLGRGSHGQAGLFIVFVGHQTDIGMTHLQQQQFSQ